MANIVFRTLFLFFALLLMLRLMGKRQIGQLQPYEFSLTLIAADLVTSPISDINTPLLWGIIPIYVLLLFGLILSFISLKSNIARKFICGSPRVLIDNGVILEKSLHAVRYTLSDLLEQLRSKDIFDVSQVHYAILETNGQISVILKENNRQVTVEDLNINSKQSQPCTALVLDGKISKENLDVARVTEKQLKKWIKTLGFKSEQDIFVLTYDKSTVYAHSRGRNPIAKELKCETT